MVNMLVEQDEATAGTPVEKLADGSHSGSGAPLAKEVGWKLPSLPPSRQPSIVGTDVESHHTDSVVSHHSKSIPSHHSRSAVSVSQAVRVPSVRDRFPSVLSHHTSVSRHVPPTHPDDRLLERELNRLRVEQTSLKLKKQQLDLDRQSLEVEKEGQKLGLETQGGSSSIPNSHPAKEHDSRNLHKIVPPYKEGDDINKWFAALERACVVPDVPQRQWAAILWLSFSGKGRDRLLTVKESEANDFKVLKNALLDGYGLTTEQYRMKFRETKKESSRDWVDFVDHSVKALEGWLYGSKVTDYESLYNLILREHILNNCVSDLLHQYLVDSDLTSLQELGKKADKWVRTRVNRKVHTGGDKDSNKKKDGKSSDKGGEKSKNESSSGPQKHSGGGGGSKSSSNQNKEKRPWCYLCKIKGHWTTDPSCPKKSKKPPTTTTPTATPSVPTNSSGGGSKPTNSQSKGVAGLTFGNLVGVGLIRETTEAVLVSEGAIDLATLVACPLNMDKYKQLPLINGVEVQAYRDTGASVTMVTEKLVHPEQHLLGHQYQVTDAHNNTLSHPMAVVNLNWGGVTGPKKVVVASDLPVDCLLGNDLETSAWAEVELEAHAAMLGIPGHILALTRAKAKKQKGQGNLDPGTMDQVLPKARASRSKALPTIPPSTVDSTSEEEEFPPCAEATPEELEADTAELLGEGGPAREELSVAEQTCPTLEGLRQQAVKQANGDVSDSHRVYWEDNLLYTEARDPKPGAARRLVIPQEYRKFLLTLAHDIWGK
ncbi:hypothetical protein NDU88_012059 [Pleurodeles waltl]|uniref:Peptidase A2 domain-containing protein n=1 Tax=Pleurodeles waltl TaxID=8319 RepID=A0AAV7S5F7_PLEWA|nr:hypothetical protein NDU88_012059 [Pleurodeles waltl]